MLPTFNQLSNKLKNIRHFYKKRLYKLFTEKEVDVIEINNETGYITRQSLVYEPDFMKYTAEFMKSIANNKEDPIPEKYYSDVR